MNIQHPKRDIEWIFDIKKKVPLFLEKMKNLNRDGMYKYSFSGDIFGYKIKWGLGNSVFFLKIIYVLGLKEENYQDIINAINYIQTFQRKDGSFYDPLIRILSYPFRILNSLKSLNFSNLRYKENKRAETRQSISALHSFGVKPKYPYKEIPKSIKQIKKYVENLEWPLPWGAGSHFSHMIFFLKHSELKNKMELINYALDYVKKLQNDDGFWYKGSPASRQKINGAMKIITSLKVIDNVKFKSPEKIIDLCLSAKHEGEACDNFNIIYVLKYCNDLTQGQYRYSEIVDLVYKYLDNYKEYYFADIGGFSFYKKRAISNYYGANIGLGKNEPDLHGTHLFLWGICMIAQILGINDKLKFKEIIP